MTFRSYELASKHLQEEAGLLLFHPQACNSCPQVILVDNLGIEHNIELKRYAFVLQKKATSVHDYLQQCAETGDSKKAQQALNSIACLIRRKMELGLIDRDPLIRTNMGILDGNAMQIDLGPFSIDEKVQNSTYQREELAKVMLSLRHWIENKHPSLLPYYYEAIDPM